MAARLTETGREEHDVEIGEEVLGIGIKHALPSHNVSWQTNAHDLKNCGEDKHVEMPEVGMLVAVPRQVYLLLHGVVGKSGHERVEETRPELRVCQAV